MANHRAEQILAAVQTKVTGLTTTGTHVDRGRGDDIPAENTPALRVAMGADTILDPWSPQVLECELEVSVFGYAYDSATNIETLLNQIRKEVTIALTADFTLGLAFVEGLTEQGAQKPDIGSDAAKPSGRLEMQFKVQYQRTRTDPST